MADVAGGVVLGLMTDYSALFQRTSTARLMAAGLVVLTEPITVSPTYADFNPTLGAAVTSQQPLTFEVRGASAVHAFIAVYFPGLGITEIVWDGYAFGPQYQSASNSRIATALGWAFSVLRSGGWPDSPNLKTYTLAPST